MHLFEHQDSEQTLAEGIAEYHAKNPDLEQNRESSAEALEFFRCHDTAHVVFGCVNDLNDEAIVKISSIFGTTGGFRVLAGYRLHESRRIYSTLGIGNIVRTAVASIVLVPRTMVRCWQMTKRWPWNDYDAYLDVALRDIRKDYGVRV